MLKFKVTEEMIKAGEAALMRCAEDYAISKGEPLPDFAGMDQEHIDQGHIAIKAVIQAAATVALKEGQKDV